MICFNGKEGTCMSFLHNIFGALLRNGVVHSITRLERGRSFRFLVVLKNHCYTLYRYFWKNESFLIKNKIKTDRVKI